jgi:hypothetical protein
MDKPTTSLSANSPGVHLVMARENSQAPRWRPVTQSFSVSTSARKFPYTNKLNCIGFIEIRFNWKKILNHGQFRTFKAIPNDPICPVARAGRILLRADTLRIPP